MIYKNFYAIPNIFEFYSQSEELDKWLEAIMQALKEIKTVHISHKNLDQDLENLVQSTRYNLEKHGLFVTQRVLFSDLEGQYFLSTIVAHPSSQQWHEIRKHIDSCPKNNPFEYEASIKYISLVSYSEATGVPLMDELIEDRAAQAKKLTLSRTSIELFIECKTCFYNRYRLEIYRPTNPDLLLYETLDKNIKLEFDEYRQKGQPHPLMLRHKINAVPLQHSDLNKWQDPKWIKNGKATWSGGIYFIDPITKILVYGGIDDLLVTDSGKWILVDYKSTSKDNINHFDIMIDKAKRQIDIYYWLFKKNKYPLDCSSYLVYLNANLNEKILTALSDGSGNFILNFESKILYYTPDCSWVEKTLIKIQNCLKQNEAPMPLTDDMGKIICKYCKYHRDLCSKSLDTLLRAQFGN